MEEKVGRIGLRLSHVYGKTKAYMKEFASTPADPVGETAYHELYTALTGTDDQKWQPLLHLPRLDEVLPPPRQNPLEEASTRNEQVKTRRSTKIRLDTVALCLRHSLQRGIVERRRLLVSHAKIKINRTPHRYPYKPGQARHDLRPMAAPFAVAETEAPLPQHGRL